MKIEIGPYLDDDGDRVVNIHIDDYDTWNMDSTLAKIILPMLKQLKETKTGSPQVDDEDLPEELRNTGPNIYDSQKSFDFEDNYENMHWKHFELRWDWIMNEMIWAFEQYNTDWEDQYFFTGKDVTATIRKDWDVKGHEKHHNRIKNGLRLFGKYYEGLWD